MEHRRDIDGLRAIAVIPVVAYHAGLPFATGGYVGVDVFFVISGYLITRLLREEMAAGTFSLSRFYERRARRILPALFVMLVTVFAAAWLVLRPNTFRELSKSAIATTLFGSNYWFLRRITDYFAPTASQAPLLHTWSLAVEEQFYILYPLLLWALYKASARWTLPVVVVLCAGSLALAVHLVSASPVAAFYASPPRAWELGLGALLALGAAPVLPTQRLRDMVGSLGLVMICLPIFFYNDATRFPGLAAIPPALGAALVIAAGASGTNWASSLLARPGLVFIGLVSYSLYLWHWPIFAFAHLRLDTPILSPPIAIACVAASFVAAVASWRLVERPFRRKTWLARRTVLALAAASAAVILAAAGSTYLTKGWPERLSPEQLRILSARMDINPRRGECLDRLASTGWCKFGASNDRGARFMLWGDSHADALMPGFDAGARELGQSALFAGMRGCPPLLGVKRIGYEGCDRAASETLEALKARTDAPLIILYARWALYETGTHMPDEAGPSALLVDEEHTAASKATSAIVFRSALHRTIDAILATGRIVVVIEGTPEIGWDVPVRMFARARWGDPLPPPPTGAQVRLRNVGVTAALKRYDGAADVWRTSFIDKLCPDRCVIEDQGKLLYADDDHLSNYAGQVFLRDQITRLLLDAPQAIASTQAQDSAGPVGGLSR